MRWRTGVLARQEEIVILRKAHFAERRIQGSHRAPPLDCNKREATFLIFVGHD
jgi:hypothetical protein